MQKDISFGVFDYSTKLENNTLEITIKSHNYSVLSSN